MTQQFPVTRDASYAQIVAIDAAVATAAKGLLDEAIRAKALESSYVEVDRKHRGSALNYDLFDVAINRAGRVVAAIYQRRFTVCTKYGNSPTKDYFLITAGRGKAVKVDEIYDAKPRLVRYARVAMIAGELIDAMAGKPSHDMALRCGDAKTRSKAIRKASPQGLISALPFDTLKDAAQAEIIRRISAGANLEPFDTIGGEIASAIFAKRLVSAAATTKIAIRSRNRATFAL